jgi:AraC-like DNA-binding protein
MNVVLAEPYGTLVVGDRFAAVELIETQGKRSAFAYRTYFLILHGMNCWLVRENIELENVRFPCIEPQTEGSDYNNFFGIPVEFNANQASISFDKKYLSRRVRRSEKALKEFLRTTPESFVRGFRRPEGLKAQIINSCLGGPAINWPAADEIAYRLDMSRSTLHRRLTQEGLSLRDILSEQRRSIASELLRNTNQTIAEIGFAAGYAEPSAFYRAFHSWYGMSPDQMRSKWRNSGGVAPR